MGVGLRWLRTGTAINVKLVTNAPVKGTVTIDPEDRKMTLKYDMPQEVSKNDQTRVDVIATRWVVTNS